MRGVKNLINYQGMSLTIRQWMDRLQIKNVNEKCIYNRIHDYKWPLDQAFTDSHVFRCQNSKERGTFIQDREKGIIDNGVEAWQELMLCRYPGYFRKENRIKVYKQLNGWYKELRTQDMKAA